MIWAFFGYKWANYLYVKCNSYFYFYCKLRCFWRILHHWQKFYNVAGSDGMDKSHLCHVLTVLSVLIFVSSKKGKNKHKVKWVAYMFSILLIWWFHVYDENNDALEAKVCNPEHCRWPRRKMDPSTSNPFAYLESIMPFLPKRHFCKLSILLLLDASARNKSLLVRCSSDSVAPEYHDYKCPSSVTRDITFNMVLLWFARRAQCGGDPHSHEFILL